MSFKKSVKVSASYEIPDKTEFEVTINHESYAKPMRRLILTVFTVFILMFLIRSKDSPLEVLSNFLSTQNLIEQFNDPVFYYLLLLVFLFFLSAYYVGWYLPRVQDDKIKCYETFFHFPIKRYWSKNNFCVVKYNAIQSLRISSHNPSAASIGHV